MSEEQVRQCQECGASVYREHLDAGIAGYFGGKLLCSYCLQEAEQNTGAFSDDSAHDMETIALVDDEAEAEARPSATAVRHKSSETQLGMGDFDDSGLKRPLNPTGAFATRCRSFHAKLTDAAVAYMNREINEWADSDENINIKFATTTVGVFEGKRSDPHLVVTVFY